MLRKTSVRNASHCYTECLLFWPAMGTYSNHQRHSKMARAVSRPAADGARWIKPYADCTSSEFLECDFEFHRYCSKLSGNSFLAETLERLLIPLFTFVVLASAHPLTAESGREHYALVEALRSMEEPDFSTLVRKTLTGFGFRWISSTASRPIVPLPTGP